MKVEMYLGGKVATFDRTRDVMLLSKSIARGAPVFLVNSRTGNTIDIVTLESEARRIVDKGNNGRGYDEARIYKRYPNGHMQLVYEGKRTVSIGSLGFNTSSKGLGR